MSTSPRVYQLKGCGMEIKKLPDISVADQNHTENFCQSCCISLNKNSLSILLELS